jgi:uroporphyrin-III C-methyltransferase / precorrin-2 dehydrogenase / sirohydrochlorin ferrochelatase
MPADSDPEDGTPQRLLPLFVKLGGRRVVLVGGGPVAAAKLKALLETGAEVTVIAPEVVPEIESAPVTIRRREFAHGDLEDAWLAVAAATPEVNRRVAEEAEERRVFVNAVDDPARASAYTGGVFRRGGVTVAVSTEGAAPALAGLLREGLEALVPEEVDSWIDQAQTLRQEWKRRGVPMPGRRPLLLEALNRLYTDRRNSRSENGTVPASGETEVVTAAASAVGRGLL